MGGPDRCSRAGAPSPPRAQNGQEPQKEAVQAPVCSLLDGFALKVQGPEEGASGGPG